MKSASLSLRPDQNIIFDYTRGPTRPCIYAKISSCSEYLPLNGIAQFPTSWPSLTCRAGGGRILEWMEHDEALRTEARTLLSSTTWKQRSMIWRDFPQLSRVRTYAGRLAAEGCFLLPYRWRHQTDNLVFIDYIDIAFAYTIIGRFGKLKSWRNPTASEISVDVTHVNRTHGIPHLQTTIYSRYHHNVLLSVRYAYCDSKPDAFQFTFVMGPVSLLPHTP